ncbi:MAG: hypothetical protein U5N86_12250 [Planctomycetota bacterium]|nr:hypothetical protein [Planctomycetota bacterium]
MLDEKENGRPLEEDEKKLDAPGEDSRAEEPKDDGKADEGPQQTDADRPDMSDAPKHHKEPERLTAAQKLFFVLVIAFAALLVFLKLIWPSIKSGDRKEPDNWEPYASEFDYDPAYNGPYDGPVEWSEPPVSE